MFTAYLVISEFSVQSDGQTTVVQETVIVAGPIIVK